MSARAVLQSRRALAWMGILVFTTCLIIYSFYGITATSFEHTYLKPPASPGTLMSDRWTRDFFFVGSIVLLFLVPLTAGFMSDRPTSKALVPGCEGVLWRQMLHVFVVVILGLYFVVILALWGADYAAKNQGTAANQYNRANDERWCCVYYAVASSCTNTVGCAGLSGADLVTNPLFLWRFWGLFVFIIFLMVDFVYTIGWFMPAVKEYLGELDQENNDPTPEPVKRRVPMATAYKGRGFK